MTDAECRLLLAARRELLVQRAAQQRVQLAQSIEPLARASIWVDRGLALRRALGDRPGLALGSVLVPSIALALWKPRGVLRAIAAAMALWRGVRSVQRVWSAARIS